VNARSARVTEGVPINNTFSLYILTSTKHHTPREDFDTSPQQEDEDAHTKGALYAVMHVVARTFSKVSASVRLLCKGSIENTFENVYLDAVMHVVALVVLGKQCDEQLVESAPRDT